MTEDRANRALVHALRQALRHLYDPAELRQNALYAWLDLEQGNSPSALRQTLLDAIHELRPAATLSPQSDAWRSYRVLYHRYVEQFNQAEVAASLGMSVRQLRRQESTALQVLADYLRVHHHLSAEELLKAATLAPADGEEDVDREDPEEQEEGINTPYEQELEWLEQSLSSEPTDVAELIQAALEIARPLCQSLAVQISSTLPEALPRVAVQVPAVRQALINVLTLAVRSVPSGQVRLDLEAAVRQVVVRISPVSSAASNISGSPNIRPSDLEIARQLVALSGGQLEVLAGTRFAIRIMLPIAERVAVLAVDDNADVLQLFGRYLAGTRYPYVATREPNQVLALAEQLVPRAIVLDVMLPGVDGWELLGRLREHPRTRDIPVIVCTILPQEQLAMTLGAAAFVRKPITQEQFLAILDQVALPAQPPADAGGTGCG
jgi:CheY-like chemotaxis protein